MKLQLRILLSLISLFLFSGCFNDPSSYIDCDITAQNEENYAMNDIVIEIQDFTKTYDGFIAVDRTIFDVKSGEIFGLLGPNGGEKTSTLECLEGLQEKLPNFCLLLRR